MKPRLGPAPLTTEDFVILCSNWKGRHWLRPVLFPIGHSVDADRRDAELMFKAMEARQSHGGKLVRFEIGNPHDPHIYSYVWCGGIQLSTPRYPSQGRDIRYFA